MSKINSSTVEKAKNKDSKAFSVIYEKTKNLVFSIALTIVKDAQDAQEVAQESYIKLFNNLENLEDNDKLVSYLSKITTNAAYDFIKKKKYDLFMQEAQDEEVPDDSNTNFNEAPNTYYIEEKIENKQTAKRMRMAIDKLPPEQAYAIIEHYYNERTAQEIADELQISRNTVLSRLKYAYKKLKKELQSEYDDHMFGILLFPLVKNAYKNPPMPKQFGKINCRRVYKGITEQASKQGMIKISAADKIFFAFNGIGTTAKITVAAVLTVAVVSTGIGVGLSILNNQNKTVPTNEPYEVITQKQEIIEIPAETHIEEITTGTGYIIYNNRLITNLGNKICYLDNEQTIFDNTANDFLLIDDNLFFITDNLIVKYDLKNNKIVKEFEIKANRIYFADCIIAVNTQSGTVYNLNYDLEIQNQINTDAKKSSLIGSNLYYYDNDNCLVCLDAVTLEKNTIFSGKSNYGMKFAYQLKNGDIYYPDFFSDENGILYKNSKGNISPCILSTPFIEFAVTDNYYFYLGYNNDLYKMKKTDSKSKVKICVAPLNFIDEKNNYTFWYSVDSDKTLIIHESSNEFDFYIDGKIENISIGNDYLFYSDGKEYFCKEFSQLQKF